MNRHMYFRQQEKNYLCHHGVKGQKWGVRRYQNPDGTLTEEGKKRYNKMTDYSKKMGATIAELEKFKSRIGYEENSGKQYLVTTDAKEAFSKAVEHLENLERSAKKEGFILDAERKLMDDGHEYTITYLYDTEPDGLGYYEYYTLIK